MADAPASPPLPPSAPPSTSGWVVRFVLAVLLVVFAGSLWYARAEGNDSTSDAYVTGHVHAVAPRVAGTIAEVLVDDNQHVAEGQVLAKLDARDFEVREQLARAQIAQAEAQQKAADAQVRQADAMIASAKTALVKAELDLARNDSLMKQTPRGIARQEFEASQAARDAARAAVDNAVALRDAARANRSATTAVEATGRANLRDADLALSYVEIRAPVAGRVGRKSVEVGARVNVGQTLLSIVGDDVWVVANFREVQLDRAKIGGKVKLTIDALPGKHFDGHIDSLSPATGAQFALLPPDNATGNFTKVVQRVPVKIRFDPKEIASLHDAIVPGLSVVAEIER